MVVVASELVVDVVVAAGGSSGGSVEVAPERRIGPVASTDPQAAAASAIATSKVVARCRQKVFIGHSMAATEA
ncbi:MAG TPA: hypothetical protein DF783_04855 [Acidimicrobiaceae bacterium]|nr:hypothetical protein [Acidimicrobiaceae bacterium]